MKVPNLTSEQIAEKQEKLRGEIRQRQELLKAYDLVVQDLGNNGTITLPVAESPLLRRPPAIEPGYGYITRLVRQAINDIGKPFRIKDLHRHIIASDIHDVSLGSVATVINRLMREQPYEIVVKRRGSGRRATIFEKA